MPTKIVIGDKKGNAFQKEITADKLNALLSLKIGDEFDGGIVDVPGYKLKLTGGSDKDGFPMRKGIHGAVRKKVLVSDGPGFYPAFQGERSRRSIRGEALGTDIAQINASVVKEGTKTLWDIFGKAPKEEAKKEEKAAEAAQEEKK